MQNQKKNKKHLTPEEYRLQNELGNLLNDEHFAYEASGSVLALLEHGHTNLHDPDLVHIFKLVSFLNTMQMVQRSRGQ